MEAYAHELPKARAVAGLGVAVEAKPGRVTPFRKRVEG